MQHKILAAVMTLAVGLGGVSMASSIAGAGENGRDRSVRKYQRKHVTDRYAAKKRKSYDDDSYAARANSLDPSGDLKGYPNWARVALSPKYGNGFR